MKIVIIGANGIAGSALTEHFNRLGHTTLQVDIDTKLTIKNTVYCADVVFVSILPLESVPDLISTVIQHVRGKSLIVNMSSIETLSDISQNDKKTFTDKQITMCHCHFHFLPEIPLHRTLFGHSITVAFSNNASIKWRKFMEESFLIYKPKWHELNPGEHDNITTVSQLTHMIICFVVGNIWRKTNSSLVKRGLSIGGPPFTLLMRSVLRTASGSKVAANILINHPRTLDLIKIIEESLKNLKFFIESRNNIGLINQISSARSVFEKENLKDIDNTTNQLIRLDADMSSCTIEFNFSKQDNRTGILAKVLTEFDIQNIEKTSTIAQVNSDGGCTFKIGVRQIDSKVKEVIQTINSW